MIATFARHPVASNLMMLVAILLGLATLPGLERETFPEFTPSQVSVTVRYPGASAIDVDDEVCRPLDDALSGTTDLDELTCLSVEGLATATASMVEGGDITQFYNDVSSEVQALDLPDAAERAAVSIASQVEQIAVLAVSGIDGTGGLGAYADDLASRLQSLPTIAQADVTGISARELRVSYDQAALRRYGLSAQDVSRAIQERSLQQPLGTVETTARDFTLRYADARRDVRELEDLIVLRGETGGLVRLRDLATVSFANANEAVRSQIDGALAATITVSKTKDADALRAFADVQTVIAAEEARLPDPFAITVVNDTTEVINERLTLVTQSMAQGLVLVFVVMWLFFRLGDALWISATLPISFLGALFVMSLLGETINMISLIALLMAVGLIMDDSIVIAENIAVWRRRPGVGSLEAAIRGTAEVMPGIISSFATTACVFVPLMFLTGEIGNILEVMPVVLLVALGVSLIEAFLILPHHLSHGGRGAAERPASRALEWVKRRAVLPVVRAFVSFRYATLGLTFAALIASIGLIVQGHIKVVGFPASEGDTIEARIALTSGIAAERTEWTVARLLDGLETVEADLGPTDAPLIERTLVKYGENRDVRDNGKHTATITVDLLTSAERGVSADAVLDAWRTAAGPLPDLQQVNFTQTEAGPGGADLDVELLGPDIDRLAEASDLALRLLLERPDVPSAFKDIGGGRRELRLALNAYAASIGLTPQSLAGQLRDAFSGTETDEYAVGATNLAVTVELSDSVASLAEFERFPVLVPGGAQASLATVADIALVPTYPQVTRSDGRVVARIQGDIDNAVTTSGAISLVALDEIQPIVREQYPEVTFRIGGAAAAQQEGQASILSGFALGLIGVYVVLAFQFRSYAMPVAVMVSIPFALIGTILGHLALGMDMSMPSFVGFASLAGIVVNNAILFLTFFRARVTDGDYIAGAVEAVGDRFRPILLSSSTTFVGLLPIIFETSPQVQTLVPLVVSVAFGLLAGTVLIVFVFPAVMAIYFDIFSLERWLAVQPTDARDDAARATRPSSARSSPIRTEPRKPSPRAGVGRPAAALAASEREGI